jgi:hypothetical protein
MRFVLLAACALLLTACGPPPTFTRVQEEIFELSCATASCHGGANPAASLKLDADDTYDNLVDQDAQVNTDWKLVVPGDVEASLLYKIVTGEVGDQRQMPPGLALDEEKTQLISDWIEAGAAND